MQHIIFLIILVTFDYVFRLSEIKAYLVFRLWYQSKSRNNDINEMRQHTTQRNTMEQLMQFPGAVS